MDRLIVFLLLFSAIGCGVRSQPSAGFERVQLDGGELASLLNLHCAKYTYRGPEMWCNWRLMAKHFGPDDEPLDETYLGSGGCGLRPGESFYFSIPAYDGGTTAIRFFGLETNNDIAPLLPKRKNSSSHGWNQRLVPDDDGQMIVAVFTVDTNHSLALPVYEMPRGWGGNVVVITLELVEGEPRASEPWRVLSGTRESPR